MANIPNHMKIFQNRQSNVEFEKQLNDRQKYELENSISKSTGQSLQKYYIETKVFYESQNIGSECNDITFINSGTTNFTINDVLLLPNQSLRISGNINEIDTTEYTLVFATSINTGNLCTIIRKLYK
jgi:hypothetical protein